MNTAIKLLTITITIAIFALMGNTTKADEINDVLALVNAERAAAGLAPLTINPALNNAALRHAQDMAANGFFSHTGSDCSTPFVRIAEAGYGYSMSGENLASGFATAGDAVNAWMQSPGHRANIMQGGFTETGIVRYGDFWVQTFGTPGGSLGYYDANCMS